MLCVLFALHAVVCMLSRAVPLLLCLCLLRCCLLPAARCVVACCVAVLQLVAMLSPSVRDRLRHGLTVLQRWASALHVGDLDWDTVLLALLCWALLVLLTLRRGARR